MCLVYAIYMVPNSTELNNDMCAIYSLRQQKPNFCRRMTSLSRHVSHITIDAVCNTVLLRPYVQGVLRVTPHVHLIRCSDRDITGD